MAIWRSARPSVLTALRGSGIAKELFSLGVVCLCCVVSSRITIGIDDGWVSAVLQKHPNNLDLTFTRGEHQRGPTFDFTDVVGIRSVVEEEVGRGRKWSGGAEHQRRPSEIIL